MIEDRIESGQDTGAGKRVAVLVDCENISHAQADLILKCAEELGSATVRRVYGDMRERQAWEADHRFDSIHTGHGRSKNTADIKLVVDAMNLSVIAKVDCFLIASNDGDFAPLASHLREVGYLVIGIGKENSASPLFREACSRYEAVLPEVKKQVAASPVAPPAEKPKTNATESKTAPAPAPKPKKVVLSKIDAAIHRQCKSKAPNNAFLSISILGQAMAKVELIKRKECGRATWLKYLKSFPNLYRVEGSGTDARVRLVSP